MTDIATEELVVTEPPTATNGHLEQTELELDVPIEPKEKFGRFADPRAETVRILQERLDRVLQPVDDDEVWHGVNVVTAKDLHAAMVLDLPPTSIFSAAARTPAFVYVSAVCPVCGIVSEIDLEVAAKLEVEGHSRKLKLKAKATTKPHQCGQQRLDDISPTRPEQVSMDDVEANANDVDFGEGPPNDEGGLESDDADDGSPPAPADAAAEADALHSLAMAVPAALPDTSEVDDLSDLPF